MSVAYFEQETVINLLRNEDVAYVYTSDTTMMTKLDKLVKSSDNWILDEIIRDSGGEIVGKKYIATKNMIGFRSKTRSLTEEQKEAASQRMKRWRNEQ